MLLSPTVLTPKLALVTSPYADQAEWLNDCLACALDAVMLDAGGVVWTEAGVERLLAQMPVDEVAAVGALPAGSRRNIVDCSPASPAPT